MRPTLLDTDVVSELVRRNPVVAQRAENYIRELGPLQLSVITYYEATSGLLYRDARQQMGRFTDIVALSEIIELTPEAAVTAARIEADLRRRGLSIGVTDTLIAGSAITNGLVLATNNTRHFERIEGLELVNWTQS